MSAHAATAPPLPAAITWTSFPFVLVRIPGLPISCLDAYRHREALALHDAARAARAALLESGEALCQRLYALVPRLTSRAHRRDVLAARRALHQGLRAPDGGWRDEAQQLDPGLAGALEEHHTRWDTYEAALRARDAQFDADADGKMEALLALLRTPRFRLGLLLANRAIAEQLDSIAPGRPLDKRERQTVIRAMRYLLRATLKPTPLGFFAGTAVVDERRPPDAPLPSLEPRTPRARPNRAVYRHVARALLSRAAVRREATVFLSPLCFEDEGRFWGPLGPGSDDGYRELPLDPVLRRRLLDAPREGLAYPLFAEHTGLSDEAIEALWLAGVLQLDAGASEAELDDAEALLRLLWRAVPRDFSVLSDIAALTSYESALAGAASLDPHERASGLAALEQAAAPLLGAEPGSLLPPLLHEDTACPAAPRLPRDAWRPFLDELATYGAGMLYADLCPEEESLAHLFRALNPGATRVPLLRFHRQYLEFCQRHGHGVDHFENALHLCRLLGLPYRDPAAPFREDLERAIEAAQGGEVVYRPDSARTARFEPASSMRLSVRFGPAPAGARGPRYQLLFWGSDRMSLFPRYAGLPCPTEGAVEEAFRAWMARWPSVADVHSSLGRNVDLRSVLTRRVLDAPDARPRPGGTPLRDLAVTAETPSGRLALVDRDGEVVSALFLGVSAPQHLPAIVRFLAHLSGHRTSLLELVTRALNQILLSRLDTAPREPIRLPAIYLGDHILLSAPVFLLGAACLPRVGVTVDRAGFFAFHDWLAEHGLPRLAQVRIDQRDPLWVDLAHPEGVNGFLRFVRSAPVFLMYPPVETDAPLSAPEGEYAVEYYMELCAGTSESAGATRAR